MEPRKQAIVDALRKFMNQRSGIEFGNYGDVKAFRAEQRSIAKDLHQARELMRAVELSSITADDLLKAAQSAFSGRLTIKACPHGDSARTVCGAKGHVWCGDCEPAPSAMCHVCNGGNRNPMKPNEVRIGYCTGQYFPTEYRRAVCAVLASALWYFTREQCMPSGPNKERLSSGDTRYWLDSARKGAGDFVSAGDWLRAHFRQQFGRGIASRWFS